MAKVTTVCERCDGTFDGTPSGWKNHVKTNKHQSAKPIPGDGLPDALRAKMGLEESIEAEPGEETTDPDTLPLAQQLAEAAAQDGKLPDEGAEVFPERKAPEILTPKVRMSGSPDPEPEPEFIVPDPEPLDERPDSLLINEFRPFDFPARSEALQALNADVAEALAAAEVDVSKFKRYVRHGELHNLKLLPKYQEQLKQAEIRLAYLRDVNAGIEANDEARYAAHYERVRTYWQLVHAAILDAAPMVGEPTLAIEATTLKIRFGAFVTVEGPRGTFGEDLARVIRPAVVTISSTFNDLEASSAIGLGLSIQAAGTYAEELNRIIGL